MNRNLPQKQMFDLPSGDVIVYTLVSNGGGVDGRDHTDTGGKIMAASLKNNWDDNQLAYNKLHKQVVDLDVVRANALLKLDPIERLAFGYESVYERF